MGFSGGGSNVLKPHTHDGRVTEDGGALNMDNVTQASLTAGDIVYSDGVALQRLAIGAVNTTLSSTGAVPQWAAASGGASTNRQVISGFTNAQTTTSATFVNCGGSTSATLTNSAGGSAFIFFSYVCENTTIGTGGICISIGGVDTSMVEDQSAPSNYIHTVSGCAAMAATSGQTIQERWRTGSGTRTGYNTTNRESLCQIFEIY
jgi:hypothetical protein